MKTVSVRQIRQNFGQLMDWVNAGEEVTVTMHRTPVARILPLALAKKTKVKWPDFAARQRKVFGHRVLKGNSVLDEREGYEW